MGFVAVVPRYSEKRGVAFKGRTNPSEWKKGKMKNCVISLFFKSLLMPFRGVDKKKFEPQGEAGEARFVSSIICLFWFFFSRRLAFFVTLKLHNWINYAKFSGGAKRRLIQF